MEKFAVQRQQRKVIKMMLSYWFIMGLSVGAILSFPPVSIVERIGDLRRRIGWWRYYRRRERERRESNVRGSANHD